MIRVAAVLIGGLCAPAIFAQAQPMAFQPPSWGPAGPHIEGAQSGPVAGRPFSGKEVRRTTQTLNDGTLVDHTEVSLFYRDSLGRMRAESPDRVEIFDPVSHVEYDLNPGRKTYRRIPVAENAAFISVAVVGGASSTSVSTSPAFSSRAKSSGGANEDLGRQMVNGLLAKGSRVTLTIPAGTFGNNREFKVVNESWYSEDLLSLVKSSNNDPRFGLNTYEMTEINQSAPAPSLFAPPTGYTLVTRDH